MGGFSLKNKKVEIIKSNEFQNLFDKSKKLIDSARSNMGQIPHSSTPLLHLCPPDKCFRCCLASLQSGLNWN